MFPIGINLLPHEIAHYKTLESIAGECTLFLKRDNNAFPINKPCKVALFGGGARHTLKCGTGSGDVNSHFFNNIETELELNGFTITSKKWLDEYDKIKILKHKDFINRVKLEAKEKRISPPAYAVGQIDKEVEYNLPIDEYNGDICIYVLSRISGESTDRKLEKGDIYLTDTEIKDILYLNQKFEKFILVLNACGVVDLSPILEVHNIYLLSQLGVVTSSILVKTILGEINPSGKLSTTWTNSADYPYINEFGDRDNTRYLEGIYVGYRYFNSKGIRPLFPFGFGLSYSKFNLEFYNAEIVDNNISLKVKVNNESDFAGKEVIQIYASSKGRINTPKDTLIYFYKTKEIKPHNFEEVELNFDLSNLAIFDVDSNKKIIQKGTYIIRGGISSVNLTSIIKINVSEDIVIQDINNILSKPDFTDLYIEPIEDLDEISIKTISIDKKDYKFKKINNNDKFDVKIPDFIKKLTIDQLICLNLGDYKTGVAGIIGQAGSLVPGAAGETTLRISEITNSLVMADGPAGLRLISEYKLNHKGHYNLIEDSIMKGIMDFLPKIAKSLFFNIKKNHKKKGNVMYQYCTAIPISTAVAQSFNIEACYEIGRLVAEEMKIYDIDIWLAPAMNIHRNICCGRNFEYYSEDPLLTGLIASSVIKGVQSLNKMACIKHFVCNNQETNRFNSNSILSERTIREIYLKGFEIAISESHPAAVMTSYNLINGVHASENKNLLVNALREEWQYKGLVMTDWITTGQINDKSSIHPCASASKDLASGVNICMPGSKKDIKDIKKALKRGKISKEQLQRNASIVYSFIVDEKNI